MSIENGQNRKSLKQLRRRPIARAELLLNDREFLRAVRDERDAWNQKRPEFVVTVGDMPADPFEAAPWSGLYGSFVPAPLHHAFARRDESNRC